MSEVIHYQDTNVSAEADTAQGGQKGWEPPYHMTFPNFEARDHYFANLDDQWGVCIAVCNESSQAPSNPLQKLARLVFSVFGQSKS